MLQLSAITSTREGDCSVEWDMVGVIIPDTCVDHSVRRERHDSPDYSASDTVIPVVILIDSKRARDERSSENRRPDSDLLPHGRMIIGPELQLSVEVESQEDKASERSCGMTGWERFQGVINLILISCADGAVVHDLPQPIASLLSCNLGKVWLADCQEVWSQTSDEPFEEDLEDSGGNETVEDTDDTVVDVPEAADADLTDEDGGDGDERSEHSGRPDRNDFFPHGVGELRVDDFAILEVDGERTRRGRVSFVDLCRISVRYLQSEEMEAK